MREIKFEEALSQLETIVQDLEGGKLGLDESVKRFEEGIQLFRSCSKKLEEAQKKIEILEKKGPGEIIAKPFKSEAT